MSPGAGEALAPGRAPGPLNVLLQVDLQDTLSTTQQQQRLQADGVRPAQPLAQ